MPAGRQQTACCTTPRYKDLCNCNPRVRAEPLTPISPCGEFSVPRSRLFNLKLARPSSQAATPWATKTCNGGWHLWGSNWDLTVLLHISLSTYHSTVCAVRNIPEHRKEYRPGYNSIQSCLRFNGMQIFNHIKNLKSCISTQNTRVATAHTLRHALRHAHAHADAPTKTHTITDAVQDGRADQSTRKVRRPDGLWPWPKALSRSQSRPWRASARLKSRCTAKDSLFSALRSPRITRVLGFPRTAWVMFVACQFSVLAPLTHSRMSPSLICRNRRMSDLKSNSKMIKQRVFYVLPGADIVHRLGPQEQPFQFSRVRWARMLQ